MTETPVCDVRAGPCKVVHVRARPCMSVRKSGGPCKSARTQHGRARIFLVAHTGRLLPDFCPCVKCFIFVLFSSHLTIHRSLTYSTQEPSIPVHLQHVWGLDSKNVGLIFICTAVSAFLCASYVHEDITKFCLHHLFGCMNSFAAKRIPDWQIWHGMDDGV